MVTRSLAILALLLSLAATAHAHDLPQERKLLVQAQGDRVEMMLVWLEPAGPAVDLLLRQFDVNGDGKLEGAEARLAGPHWLPKALGGLEFEVIDASPRSHPPEFRFRREAKGALSMAVLLRYDLPALAAGVERRLRVALAQGRQVPTEVELSAKAPLAVARVERGEAVARKGPAVLLEPGEQTVVVFAHPE